MLICAFIKLYHLNKLVVLSHTVILNKTTYDLIDKKNKQINEKCCPRKVGQETGR